MMSIINKIRRASRAQWHTSSRLLVPTYCAIKILCIFIQEFRWPMSSVRACYLKGPEIDPSCLLRQDLSRNDETHVPHSMHLNCACVDKPILTESQNTILTTERHSIFLLFTFFLLSLFTDGKFHAPHNSNRIFHNIR